MDSRNLMVVSKTMIYSQTTIPLLIIILVTMGVSTTTVVFIKATNQTQYRAGYIHGLHDPDLKEILENTTFTHTQSFNQGYIDGWCSLPGNGPYSGSDADQGTFECQYDATHYNNSTTADKGK
ncbi:MAG: hypothetical protein WA364_22125 [Candidatus Nitrosopolaris sp.]